MVTAKLNSKTRWFIKTRPWDINCSKMKL